MFALWAIAILAAAAGRDLPSDFILSPPRGPLLAATPEEKSRGGDFRSGTPLVATSYFYWYDAASKAHVVNHDGSDALTDHPPTLVGFSYKNVDWHAEQLADMQAAGIDVLLPVYWGTPLAELVWSDEGLRPLVAARERLLAQGKTPPAIGMFYDTSTLAHNKGGYHVDLTTPAGRRWFYGTIRNFFSQIPARHRATIDGRPLVFLYASAFARRVDEQLFPETRAMFRRDFGTDLFLVKMRGWPGAADSEYQWGGALKPQYLETVGLGPGYDHSAVPGRTPLVRKREEGQFYQRAWQRLLMKPPESRPSLVHLETWNEFHEGTDVCHSREYGRQYIELTRKFADLFHARRQLNPSTLVGFRAVASASPDRSEGLSIRTNPKGDGLITERTIEGRRAWSTAPNQHSPTTRYLYFAVDDTFWFDAGDSVEVTVSYFDRGPSEFQIQYDSNDPKLEGLRQQFRFGGRQRLEQSGQWKQSRFTLSLVRFAGLANGADFRLATAGEDLVISGVSLRRIGKAAPRRQ